MGSFVSSLLEMRGFPVLLLVFALPALESSAFVGFIFPGEIAAILGGVAAYEHRVSLPAVIAAAVLGAVIGDTVGYAIGRHFGRPLLERVPTRLLKPHHVDRASHTVNRLGGKAVFVGRFTAALRVLVPGLAGMARMRYRTFVVWNVVGGTLWATGSVVLGYVAGSGWRHLEEQVKLGGFGLGALIVLIAVAVTFVRRRQRRRRRHDSAVDSTRLVAAATVTAHPAGEKDAEPAE